MRRIDFWILSIITAIGLFAVLRLPGAGFALTTFITALSALILYKSIQTKKWPEILIGIGYFCSYIGSLFRLMHWAGAGALYTLGAISVIGFIAVGIRFMNQKIYGSQKFSLIMIAIGFFMSLIHSLLSFYHAIPTHSLEILRLTFPILIIFPTILLLITKPELFCTNGFYPILLILTAAYLVTSSIWLRNLILSM